MIIRRRDSCGSQPRSGGGGVDMSAPLSVGGSLVETNDKKRVFPVRTAGHQRHECLEKSVHLGCRAIMHVVDHVGDDEGKVHRRVETRQALNVCALALVESNVFETNRGIVFSDVRSGKARAVDQPVGVCLEIGAIAGIALSVDAP
jgi:hypothetical protein